MLLAGVLKTDKMEELEAKMLGISVEKYRMWKTGFEETYAVVDETFEKGYKIPKRKRRSWKDCVSY